MELAGNVNHTSSASVITNVHDIVLHPHIVRAFLWNLILCDFSWIENIGDIYNVNDASGRNACPVGQVKLRGQHFIAEEYIVFVTENGCGPGRPPRSVRLGVVEAELTAELRIFWTAAFNAVSDTKNHQPIFPVTQIGKSVYTLNVVQQPATTSV